MTLSRKSMTLKAREYFFLFFSDQSGVKARLLAAPTARHGRMADITKPPRDLYSQIVNSFYITLFTNEPSQTLEITTTG